MQELITTEAIVLGTSRWKESSKIVQLYSRSQGYIRLAARGALRPKSQLRGVLETLNLIEVVYRHREGQTISNLNSGSQLRGFMGLRESLRKTAVAFGMLELVRKLLAVHEPVPEFFDYLSSVLHQLDEDPHDLPHPYLWHFMLELSNVLGFAWQLDRCQNCGREPDVFPATLHATAGHVTCGKCLPGPSETGLNEAQWHALQLLRRSGLPESADARPAYEPLRELKLTHLLLNHLAYHTDTRLELNSLKWYV